MLEDFDDAVLRFIAWKDMNANFGGENTHSAWCIGARFFYSWDSGRIGVFNELPMVWIGLASLLNERRSEGHHNTAIPHGRP